MNAASSGSALAIFRGEYVDKAARGFRRGKFLCDWK
jgi:hypothetical protein